MNQEPRLALTFPENAGAISSLGRDCPSEGVETFSSWAKLLKSPASISCYHTAILANQPTPPHGEEIMIPLCMKPMGKRLSFPATSHPITQHSLLHISVKQQARLHSEFNVSSSEPLGLTRYGEHCLHNTNLFLPLQK